MSKVIKKLVIKGSVNRGVKKFSEEYILNCYNKGIELDKKKMDSVLFEKFGISKSGDKSRMKSINWYINDLVNRKLINI